MKKKLRFDPEITRVKLNPEQAVLQCNCYTQGVSSVAQGTVVNVCKRDTKLWGRAARQTAGLASS